jgi:hypothetical protein
MKIPWYWLGVSAVIVLGGGYLGWRYVSFDRSPEPQTEVQVVEKSKLRPSAEAEQVQTPPKTGGWQYTRWGMTVDEAIKASNGQLQPCNPQACDKNSLASMSARAFGPYQSGELKFTAFLLFDDAGRLERVHLSPSADTDIGSIVGALESKYGEASDHSKDELLETWKWLTPTDAVSVVTGMGLGTVVNYWPRLDASSKGM